MVKVYKCDAEPKQMHEWVNKTIFSTEVLIPKSQGQDSACPWTAFLFLVFMTLPSTYKFKQALVKAPYPWPPLDKDFPGLALASLWSRTCIALESPPPHTCSNLFNLDLTVQGPPDIFKLVQLGPHCTGTPWTFSNLFIMKHIQFTSGRLASFWNAFLLFFLIAIRYSQQ